MEAVTELTFQQQAVLWGQAYEVLVKRGVLACLIEQGLVTRDRPGLRRWTDTKLLEVFIDDAGMAYVDFSEPLAANHPGGMLNEQATVYSIVDSLTYNLPEIHQVKILIGGAERETLAGHVLLAPLEMDLAITNVTTPPQEQVAHAN